MTVIRRFRPDDAEGLLDFDSRPSPRREQKLKAVRYLSSYSCFVAEDDGELLGLIIVRSLMEHNSHEVVQINVKEVDWRCGIGTELMKAAFDAIGPGGHVSLCVNTDNRCAQRFYESLGFKLSGFTRDYRKGQDKLWYAKAL